MVIYAATLPPRPGRLAQASATLMRPVSAAHTVSPTKISAARVSRSATPISTRRSLLSPNIHVSTKIRRACAGDPSARIVLSCLLSGYWRMSCAVVSRAALGRLRRCGKPDTRLRGDGAALLGDDRIGLVVGTTVARIAAINVGPELGDAVRRWRRR